MPAQDLVHGFTAGSLETLRTCLQGSCLILPTGRRITSQSRTSQLSSVALTQTQATKASKSLPGSAGIFYPGVTVCIVMPSATPSKNQQDTGQLVLLFLDQSFQCHSFSHGDEMALWILQELRWLGK